MTRASKVITLVLLGSALALIGWSCYRANEDPDGQNRGQGHTGHSGSHVWFWGGGGYGGRSAPASRGATGTSRGGFGSTGAAFAAGG